MWISLYIAQSKCRKIHWHQISTIGLNVLWFFCVPLFTEFLSDVYEKFQVASNYDTNVEFQIWRFHCNLFLSYADNRHRDTHTHTHTDQKLKIWFSWYLYTKKGDRGKRNKNIVLQKRIAQKRIIQISYKNIQLKNKKYACKTVLNQRSPSNNTFCILYKWK